MLTQWNFKSIYNKLKLNINILNKKQKATVRLKNHLS